MTTPAKKAAAAEDPQARGHGRLRAHATTRVTAIQEELSATNRLIADRKAELAALESRRAELEAEAGELTVALSETT